MLENLKHWFSRVGREPVLATPRKQYGGSAGILLRFGDSPLLIDEADIDIAFSGFILGATSWDDCELSSLERRALREIDKIRSGKNGFSTLIPRPPSVMPRIMQTLRDGESSNRQLATDLARDPALVGEVVRLSNSPYYRVGRQIDSLELALLRLGRTAVRQLVSRAIFKPLLNIDSGHFSRISSPLLWDQAEKTAVVSDCLAKREGVDRFHAYLAGIVHNAGLSVLMTVLDRNYDGTDVPRSLEFRTRLLEQATRLASRIAGEWDFPHDVVDALAAQSSARTRPGALADVLYIGDKLAKIHCLCERRYFTREDRKNFTCRLQNRPSDSCAICYQTLVQLRPD